MTNNPIISSKDLGNIFEQCTNDLRNGNGGKLLDLAGVMNAIADCNNFPYLHIFPQGIGALSTEFLHSHSVTTIPVLPEQMRESHVKLLNVATEQAIKALDVMKEQLCDNDTIDYAKLMDAVGIFFQQAGILSRDRRQFVRTQPEE